MIEGYINSIGEPIVELRISGAVGSMVTMAAVINTGFSDYLTLPMAVIESLELPWAETTRVQLADGTSHVADVYRCRVQWDGTLRSILVQAAETDALAGLKLLRGCHLEFDFIADGRLTIDKLD